MDMTSAPKAGRRWWQDLVFRLEAYLALAGVLYLSWPIRTEWSGAALGMVVSGISRSSLGLLIAGITLLIFRKPKWGWIAMGFTAYGLVLVLLLPALLRAK
jgi:hypothetical protein